ncbi:MAG: response regulator [SAR324 cluster bacterium]|nr:response regulator [SAR324 cluster bacterium]
MSTGANILIVDDNESNRKVLQDLIISNGHTPLVAENGYAALSRIRQQQPDLILLDITMPEMDGFEVLERLKADKTFSTIPVIMISSIDDMASIVRCIEIGAEDYLIKPFNRTLLNARIGNSLAKKTASDQELKFREQLEKEKELSENLLHAILPHKFAEELRTFGEVRPRRHENIAILMSDIVGFTPYCESHTPEELFSNLQKISDHFETIFDKHQLEKINAVGDAFMAAAGLEKPLRNPVLNCVQAGLELQAAVKTMSSGWQIRIGVHIGPIIAGVIGRKKFLYTVLGDTVNIASRMESNGKPGLVCVSAAAWEKVADFCNGESQGMVAVKGKGEMEIYYAYEMTG